MDTITLPAWMLLTILLACPGAAVIGMAAGAFFYYRGTTGGSPLPSLPSVRLKRHVTAEPEKQPGFQPKRARI